MVFQVPPQKVCLPGSQALRSEPFGSAKRSVMILYGRLARSSYSGEEGGDILVNRTFPPFVRVGSKDGREQGRREEEVEEELHGGQRCAGGYGSAHATEA